jgi:signal transduction histidine kinase
MKWIESKFGIYSRVRFPPPPYISEQQLLTLDRCWKTDQVRTVFRTNLMISLVCDLVHETALLGRCIDFDQPQALAVSVRYCSPTYYARARSGADLRFQGDPTQIQQVLINLVGNAFEAMRDKPVNKRRVELTTEKNGDETIRVSVRDYGVGISDEARERLFEQFFTTKEEGLGMGLTIVRSIIEAHGGKIEAENVPGGGARFHFTLPASK